jgi:anti-sigma B factor antagonist
VGDGQKSSQSRTGIVPDVPGPPRLGGLSVNSVQFADAMQFVLSGELDLSNADALKDVLWRALENARRNRGAPARLILDMRRLTFIDSTGIQALVVTKRRCEEKGTRLALKVGTSQVGRMLSLAGVADFLGTE